MLDKFVVPELEANLVASFDLMSLGSGALSALVTDEVSPNGTPIAQENATLVKKNTRQEERILELERKLLLPNGTPIAQENADLVSKNARQEERIGFLEAQLTAPGGEHLVQKAARLQERITHLEARFMLPSGQTLATENARLTQEHARKEERIVQLQAQLVLPNGETIATKNARLELENSGLREELVTAKASAAKVSSLEHTITRLQNELGRRDQQIATPTTNPRPQGKSRPPPTPTLQDSAKRPKSPLLTRGGQSLRHRSAESEHEQIRSTTPAVDEHELSDHEDIEVMLVKKTTWRPPREIEGELVKTFEELLERLDYFDGTRRIQATELDDDVKELLKPFLSRFRTELGFASLAQTVKNISKCAVSRLYKGNESCSSASCDYC
ncbi:hypothetical protein Slin14017_G114530 [Septoria linicola]|nr:hypothetical protein Slin14017_G114530 [Septoria linicola]